MKEIVTHVDKLKLPFIHGSQMFFLYCYYVHAICSTDAFSVLCFTNAQTCELESVLQSQWE